MVSNNKFVSVGVKSQTELNAPQGCAMILIGIYHFADQNHAPSLTGVRLEILSKLVSGIINEFHYGINPSCTRYHFSAQDVEIWILEIQEHRFSIFYRKCMLLKAKAGLSLNELAALSSKALEQFSMKRYNAEMQHDGITNILSFGIAFSGKKTCIKTEQNGFH